LEVKPFMVRQAHHERLNLMAVNGSMGKIMMLPEILHLQFALKEIRSVIAPG